MPFKSLTQGNDKLSNMQHICYCIKPSIIERSMLLCLPIVPPFTALPCIQALPSPCIKYI